jgi:hypothetical protein
MKIVDRKTFLTLPYNTLYRKFSPIIFGDLEIKEDTIENGIDGDWWSVDLHGYVEGCDNSDQNIESIMNAVNKGSSFTWDLETAGRDGLYDRDEMYAVYENADIEQLIERLKDCIK